jgi:hypothetical protein
MRPLNEHIPGKGSPVGKNGIFESRCTNKYAEPALCLVVISLTMCSSFLCTFTVSPSPLACSSSLIQTHREVLLSSLTFLHQA